MVIAAYSSLPLKKGLIAKGKGFLASLTNQKVFESKKGRPVTLYDNYFLLFGNSEIKIQV